MFFLLFFEITNTFSFGCTNLFISDFKMASESREQILGRFYSNQFLNNKLFYMKICFRNVQGWRIWKNVLQFLNNINGIYW